MFWPIILKQAKSPKWYCEDWERQKHPRGWTGHVLYIKNKRRRQNNIVQDYVSFPSCLMSIFLQMHGLNFNNELLLMNLAWDLDANNWALVLNPKDKNLEVWIQETKRAAYMLTLLSSILNDFVMCMCLCLCECTGHLCRHAQGQKRASDPLELEV